MTKYTDEDRAFVAERNRGKRTRPGWFRNFCVGCGLPMEVKEKERWAARLLCPDCAGSGDGAADHSLGYVRPPVISKQGDGK